jgi:hypothetical protein
MRSAQQLYSPMEYWVLTGKFVYVNFSFTVGYVWIHANLWSKSEMLLVSYMYKLFPKSAPTEHRSCPITPKVETSYHFQHESDECKIVLVHHIKAYGGHTGIAPLILNLSTRWRWIASRCGCFTQGKNLVTYRIGGWLDSRDRPGRLGEDKNSL